MKRFWQCSQCGGILEKPSGTIGAIPKLGGIAGVARCGFCGHTHDAGAVYSGAFDFRDSDDFIEALRNDPAHIAFEATARRWVYRGSVVQLLSDSISQAHPEKPRWLSRLFRQRPGPVPSANSPGASAHLGFDLSALLDPVLTDPSTKTRLRAVQALPEQEVFALSRIVKTDDNEDVRLLALRKLDPRWEPVISVARCDPSPKVRREATAKLSSTLVLTAIAIADPDGEVRATAFSRISASMSKSGYVECFTARVAEHCPDQELAVAAVAAIDAPRLLSHVIRRSSIEDVIHAAIGRLDDIEQLRSLASKETPGPAQKLAEAKLQVLVPTGSNVPRLTAPRSQIPTYRITIPFRGAAHDYRQAVINEDVDFLLEVLEASDDPMTRMSAVNAIAAIGDPAAVHALVPLLNEWDTGSVADSALVVLGWKPASDREHFNSLVARRDARSIRSSERLRGIVEADLQADNANARRAAVLCVIGLGEDRLASMALRALPDVLDRRLATVCVFSGLNEFAKAGAAWFRAHKLALPVRDEATVEVWGWGGL